MGDARRQQLRLAVVGRYYNQQGGVSNVMAQLVMRAARSGRYDVHLFSNEVLDLEAGLGNLTVHHVPMSARPVWLQVPTFARNAGKAVAATGPFDVIHVHDPQMPGADLYTAHSCYAAYLEQRRRSAGPSARLASSLFPAHVLGLRNGRRAYAAQDARIVAVSESVARQIDTHYARHTPTGHIYNGVDVDRFTSVSRSDAREWLARALGLDLVGDFVVSFVGYEFERKRLRVSMQALCEVAHARLVVAGKGPVEEYRRIAAELGVADRVHFLGHVTHVERVLRASDAFMFPTRYEAASLAILEALASGTPTITTDVAMAHEVLQDNETALLLPNTEESGPASDALKKLVDDVELQRRLTVQGQRLAATFSWDSIWERYDELYTELTEVQASSVD